MGLTIGVDIGGTKIAAGVVDEAGAIIETHTVATPSTPGGIVDAICSAVAGAGEGHRIEAVGIGAAGYVDDKRATVLFAPNIDWRHEPLKDKVEQRVGLPVVVENDANAAAWGEFRFGAGQGHEDVIVITLGTGLGGGIIIGNKLRRGRFGVAAEFGHIRVVPDGLLCGCGSQGCWEQYASGRALVRYARQRAAAAPEAAAVLLGLGDGTPEGIEGRHVSEAARQGDPVAVDSFRELARWAGAGLADLASLFDPSAFIIGGGVSDEGELVLEPIRKSFRRWLIGAQWRPHAQVVAARLGNRAGLVGAADLARQG
ncbi:ROK family glucokinase [Streptomyces clavuligerus]|uniref:Glucokinase n=1 Tax=Streptomyces clavuligerus TaxID=1901 RepID=C6GZ82_STRCL|nr:ROK family glucokinase [Streptomyces clavuligerus]ANW20585.1 glucokinase [Streptomyces clavuligerus]AXU15211.1 ROK family protein [Streptomyces clavuligerus]EFG06419.1 Glucose kinase [Streptomyces clavuligerus]MBY6305284.1 ROK family glucokinase [Streptomyces clavuligerus]QCS07987.1 glucokinase [Streptomyces clavuligerus]